ncbi:MAG: hypothetical protein AB1921_00505 [Thermodesulfobacteriota bacterium]
MPENQGSSGNNLQAYGETDKKELIRRIYRYIEQKALDAYNSGEVDFFIGYKMVIRELNIEMTADCTFAFVSEVGENEEYDISFYDEKCEEFIYKVGRLLMKYHKEKIARIEMADELLRLTFT